MIKLLLLLVPAIFAGAGCGSRPTASDSTMPSGRTAPLEYRSAFAGYRPFRDEPIAPWRDANEAVKEAVEPAHRHGGHR